jgi:hypothetical protein
MGNDLQDTIDTAIEDLKTWMEDNPGAEPGDEISEIADSSTPIYYGGILRCALEDMSLALDEPECGPAFDGKATPINIIAANIYERLTSELWEYYHDHEDDYLEDEPEEDEDKPEEDQPDLIN